MNTRRMTPAELLAIISSSELSLDRIAGMAGVRSIALARYLAGAAGISAPVSKTLCTHLLALGLAVDLARPWVPDALAGVLAPTRAA